MISFFFANLLIQSHVCVLQTALDLLERGYDVFVLADGVSSCNREEVPIALERMRQAGAQITTSESISFQLMGTYERDSPVHPCQLRYSRFLSYLSVDSASPNFKALAGIIKEEKQSTKDSLQMLLPRK